MRITSFHLTASVALAYFVIAPINSHAEEEDNGAAIYQRTCIACHGEKGEGNPELKSPPIAGLPPWYVSLQLERFRADHRGNHPKDIPGQQMAAIAKTLVVEDIPALSQHVSGMKRIPTPPSDDGDPKNGKTLFLENCAECHRFNASGEEAFRSPPLAFFPAWYLRDQFGKFQNGRRGADAKDEDGSKMKTIACSGVTDADLTDILAYITGLDQE
ncbi:MAG: c-type cytochrome [Luteolibacter sp.]